MNTYTMLNQEFTRSVVEEWSDEAGARQQETTTARIGIAARLIAWVRAQCTQPGADIHVARQYGRS